MNENTKKICPACSGTGMGNSTSVIKGCLLCLGSGRVNALLNIASTKVHSMDVAEPTDNSDSHLNSPKQLHNQPILSPIGSHSLSAIWIDTTQHGKGEALIFRSYRDATI